jgi:hypothetical protein
LRIGWHAFEIACGSAVQVQSVVYRAPHGLHGRHYKALPSQSRNVTTSFSGLSMKIDFKGIHKVTKRLADGTIRYHYYLGWAQRSAEALG